MAPTGIASSNPVIEAPSPCAATGFLPHGYPLLVPKGDGGHFMFCTHDKLLFDDFLANGFCNMQQHSPRDLFSSRILYDCPDLATTDLGFSIADVGVDVLQSALPVILVAGFMLGFVYATRHAKLDPTRKIPLYPPGWFSRCCLVLGCGILVASMMVPWLLWMVGVLAYGLVSFVAWPFFGAAMFRTLPKHPFDFWAPFLPLAWRVRERMGGVGDVQALLRSRSSCHAPAPGLKGCRTVVELSEPRRAYVYIRSRRERRRRIRQRTRFLN